MKKKIGTVLSLCLVICTAALFAEPIPDAGANQTKAGQILQEFNIIKGTEKGLEEQNPLNREQSIVILIRMLGLEKDALLFPAYGQFVDIPRTHWAASYVDFAYQRGLTNGIGEGRFGANQAVNKKVMATYMLRALGHSADWAEEDIMEKARTLAITSDAGIGSEAITRGQAFIYMANTLMQPKKDGAGNILASEVFARFRDRVSETAFQGGAKNPQDVKEDPKEDAKKEDAKKAFPKAFTAVKLPPSFKPIGAKTSLYDELELQFNTLVGMPTKDNFAFTVEGRKIEDAHYNISPGGNSIRFKFSNQNLHGKTIVCKISDLRASDGRSAIADATVTAEFKDFTPIQFVQAEVIDQKSFRGILSVNVMPPDGHMKGTEGHEVYSDGRRMVENVDYRLGWGGKEFKVVFSKPEVYPKESASLKIWGYMTAPYHKFMDQADQIELDFSTQEKKEIPLAEVKEPAPAEILVEQPKIDVMEIWKDVPVVEEAKDEDRSATKPAEASKNYGEVKESGSMKANPIVIIDQHYTEYKILLYTDGRVGSVEGLKLVDSNQNEIKVKYRAFENSYNGRAFYGFEVIPEDSGVKRDFGGSEIFVEKLYEAGNQVYTGPFSIQIRQIIN